MDRYLREEKALIREALEEKKRLAILKLEKVRHYKRRCLSIQEYFRRLACYNKISCVLEFVERLRNPTIKYQVVSSLPLHQTKIDCYWAVDPRTEDPYQKMIWDHDRMLDQTTLIETLKNDLSWFDSLGDDHQYNLTMQLLNLCSSSVRRKMYTLFRKVLKENWTKLMAYREERLSVCETTIDSIPVESTEEAEYDPKHPATIELTKQRKKWADMIEDYKKDVMAPPLKAEIRSKTSGKSGKTKSSVRSTIMDCDIDIIQLLPIWIVKNILSYFSNAELINFSLVNNYWHYVCEDIMKERKAREKLTLALEALRERIDPKIFQKLASQKSIEVDQHDLKTKRKKDHPHYAYAALDKRLVPEKLKNLCNHTIFQEEQYETNEGRFQPFPRVIKAKAEIPKTQPCDFQDIGVKFHVDEDVEEQESFVTYSLSTSQSEIIHGVDQFTLNEW